MAKKVDFWVIMVIALLAYAFIPGVQNFVNNMFGQVGAPSQVGAPVSGAAIPCPIEDTTITLDIFDKYSQGSAVTNGSNRVFLDGVDRGYVTDSGSFTASPGQKYKIIFGENSTSAYSKMIEGEVPCSGTMDLKAGLAAYDNSVSFTVYSEDGETITQASGETDTQDMSASSTYTLPFKLQVTAKQSFGNPDHPAKGNIVCFMYNKTQYDSFEVSGEASAPQPNAVATGSTNETSCWYIPVIQNDPDVKDGTAISSLVVDGKYEGDIYIETSSSYSDPGATDGNLTMVVVDTALDLDADTLDLILDVEDETNNDLGTDVEQTDAFQHS